MKWAVHYLWLELGRVAFGSLPVLCPFELWLLGEFFFLLYSPKF